MVVPGARTADAMLATFPPSTFTIVPTAPSSWVHVNKVNFEIDAIEGIASPRNPIVPTEKIFFRQFTIF